jgi:outer membrane protein TolC
MQEIPNAARRHASAEAAGASIEQAEAQRRVHLVAVRAAAGVAWINRYYAERRLALLDELGHENELFAAEVQAQLAGGRGAPVDLIAPQQEAADLEDRRDALQAEVIKARASLQRLLGTPGQETLAGGPPDFALDTEQLRSHVHAHPELAVYGPMIAVAHARIHEAEAAKVPDWSVELSYARRAPEYSDMVSLQFTLALPFFAATRQDPLIDASRKELHRLEAERVDLLRMHTEGLETELADYTTLSRQLARVRDVRLPLVRQKVDYQLAGYQSNKADLTAVLAARRELIETRMTEIDLQKQRDVAAARIYLNYEEGAP